MGFAKTSKRIEAKSVLANDYRKVQKHHTRTLPGSKSAVGSLKFFHTWLCSQMFQGRVGQRHLPVSRSQYPSQWHTHISSILKNLCPDARLVSHFLLHKETCTKDTYCLEKRKDKKKGRAPRWATFRWGLALKSSRTTENEASLTRCPCCQHDGSFNWRFPLSFDTQRRPFGHLFLDSK